MTQVEWIYHAKLDGFSRIEAFPVDGGFAVAGVPSSGAPFCLPTARGERRVFASLDTLAKFLEKNDVHRWQFTGLGFLGL